MFTEIVLFDLPGNEPGAPARILASAALWQSAPDLLHAQFLHDEAAGTAGVAYLWRNRAAAAQGHDAGWHARLTAIFGPPRITELCAPDYRDRDAPWPAGALAA